MSERERKFELSLMNVFIGVGVCLIVALMFLPTHSGRVRDQARRAMCLNNLKQIGVSLRLYREDNSGRLPCDVNSTVLGSFALLINNYQTSYKTWICPSDPGILAGSAFNPWTTSNLSYAYGGFELTAGVQPDTPSVCDRSSSGNPTGPTPWQNNMWTHKYDGGNVLFADGHVAFVKTMTPPMYRGKNP